MAILSNVVDDFISALNQRTDFDGIKVIKAYPYVIKPTKLSKIVVAVSLGDVSGDNVSIGDNCVFGTYRIDACIYSPYDVGADVLPQVAEKIFDTCVNYNPVAITTTQIDTNATALCYTLKCSVTFSDYINFGGGEAE